VQIPVPVGDQHLPGVRVVAGHDDDMAAEVVVRGKLEVGQEAHVEIDEHGLARLEQFAQRCLGGAGAGGGVRLDRDTGSPAGGLLQALFAGAGDVGPAAVEGVGALDVEVHEPQPAAKPQQQVLGNSEPVAVVDVLQRSGHAVVCRIRGETRKRVQHLSPPVSPSGIAGGHRAPRRG
jgi:hypothetical protein